ncbi:uncharacterized protein [Macrobrachium rosenbergii]|uniref:uncharacterized protein n=1 Tax=Macrobrachium rosenbergii TaxID=79674 RepID=UPI0034D55982
MPMEEATSSACTGALLSSWISRFSVLDHRMTDRGPAFLSKLWTTLACLLGTTHYSSTTYNPAANGMVERFHRSLKASLMAHCTSENWKYQLPWVLLRLRTGPRANGNPSSAEKVYGETLVVPGELVAEDRDNIVMQRLHDRVGKFAPCQRTYTDKTSPFMPPGLSSNTHVFVRDDAVWPPLTRPYRGPFLVLERDKKAFQVAIHRKEDWISVDLLKPAFLEEDVGGSSQSFLQDIATPSQPHAQENVVGIPRKPQNQAGRHPNTPLQRAPGKTTTPSS